MVEQTYRGPDRRRGRGDGGSVGRELTLATATAVVVAFAFAAVAWRAGVGTSGLEAVAHGVVLMLAATFATLLALRWLIAHDAAVLWMTAAACLLVVGTVAWNDVLAVAGYAMDPHLLAWAQPAAVAAVAVLLGIAVRTGAVDEKVGVLRVVLTTLLVAAVAASGALGVYWAEGSGWLSTPAADAMYGTATLVVVPVGFGVLAVMFLLRGIREQRVLIAAVGAVVSALLLCGLVRVSGVEGGSLAHEVVLGGGLLIGVLGAASELRRVFVSQDHLLFTSQMERVAVEDSRAVEEAARAERTHEARNALSAIEGATLALGRYREQLDDMDRESLAMAVRAEISRLHDLITEDARQVAVPFDLAEVVYAQLALVRSRGAAVTTELAEGLEVVGHPDDCAKIVANLLVNAARHAPGCAVHVTGAHEGDEAVLRVADSGLGVPWHLRDRIFERGFTTGGEDSSGLGLHVSRELATAQGGRLELELGTGGATFALGLPRRGRIAGTATAGALPTADAEPAGDSPVPSDLWA